MNRMFRIEYPWTCPICGRTDLGCETRGGDLIVCHSGRTVSLDRRWRRASAHADARGFHHFRGLPEEELIALGLARPIERFPYSMEEQLAVVRWLDNHPVRPGQWG